jgi:1-deoxy-D-xylulose 5-phosphate reductoisomerase
VVLNAANELAVAAFLEERLPWQGIAPHVQQALETAHTAGMAQQSLDSLGEVLALDAWVRQQPASLSTPL